MNKIPLQTKKDINSKVLERQFVAINRNICFSNLSKLNKFNEMYY